MDMLRALGRIAGRLIPTGLALPILLGPLRCYRWISGAAAGAGGGLSTLFNLSEPVGLRAAAALAPRGGAAFDVGSNVGMYALLFSGLCAEVFAFEPHPRNIRYLMQTMSANEVSNVTVIPCAVTDAVGMQLFAEGDNPALGHLDPDGNQPVFTISLDVFCHQTGTIPGIVKIDVEGAEEQVLEGARGLLRDHHPAVLLSTHRPDIEAACIRLMRDVGYAEPERIEEDPRTGGSLLVFHSGGAPPSGTEGAKV